MAETLGQRVRSWMRRMLGVQNLVHPITGERLAELLNMNYTTDSGMVVTQETARKVSAVSACVRILDGAVGSLPCQVFRRGADNDRALAPERPEYPLLHNEPNPLMSSALFFGTAVEHYHLEGNWYALIGRNRGGDILDLLLLDPRGVTPERKGSQLIYHILMLDGSRLPFDQDDILHVPNIFYDIKTGKGMSTIRGGAQSIGLSLAAERHSATYFGKGAVPSVAIRYGAQSMAPETKDKIIEYWQKKYGGGNAHTPAVLTDGATITPLTVNATDAQLLESRQFQVVDIARLFGVPPWMIGSMEKTTSWGTGIEQISIGFVTYTLRPMLARIEQEINRKLFRDGRHFAEFNVDGLLRGDIKSRHEAHQIALGGNQMPGWMSRNEVRKLNNLPPVENGEKIYDPPAGGEQGAESEKKTNAVAA